MKTANTKNGNQKKYVEVVAGFASTVQCAAALGQQLTENKVRGYSKHAGKLRASAKRILNILAKARRPEDIDRAYNELGRHMYPAISRMQWALEKKQSLDALQSALVTHIWHLVASTYLPQHRRYLSSMGLHPMVYVFEFSWQSLLQSPDNCTDDQPTA